MFAWHVHTVLVLVTAYHTGIRVGLLADQGHFDLADVGLVGTDLEDCFVLYLEKIALLSLD